MPIGTEVRKYGETVRQQGKVALDEARKPWYAAVGATDLAYDRIREQLKELPTEAQGRLRRLQSGAGELDAAHLRQAVETARAQALEAYGSYVNQAREAYGSYLTQARETYDKLAHRGELVVRRLRRSSEVREAFGRTEQLLDKAEQAVGRAEEAVGSAEEKVTRPGGTSASKAAARKAPAKRPTTRA